MIRWACVQFKGDYMFGLVRSHSTYLSAGGRGGAGVSGVFAAGAFIDGVIVVSVLLVVFGVGGQRVEEEDPGDESVHDRREQQRQHEKNAEIKEVNG